ncbi:unnamed protein product [Bursaphelenchus xylophilus]|nr:unnamed protein product [Bursaphelenchus xylophilus]CAG9081537.1 unnamed protein product [Bursaphelenchus xylophilus]
MIGHKRRVTGLEFIDKGAEVLSLELMDLRLITSNKGQITLVSAEFEEVVSFDQDQGITAAAVFNGSTLTIEIKGSSIDRQIEVEFTKFKSIAKACCFLLLRVSHSLQEGAANSKASLPFYRGLSATRL